MMKSNTALAAVFTGVGNPIEIREYPVIEPTGDMARIRMIRSGICGTDIHIAEGRLGVPPPFIPGHELVGRIDRLGPRALKDGMGATLKEGDVVMACVAMPCGKCFNCRRGGSANCLNAGVTYVKDPGVAPHFHGGYGEVLFQPASTLVRVPGSIDVEAAAAYPCAGPTAIHAYNSAGGLKKGESVVVQGTGPVGMFAIAYAKAAGCHVAAIGSRSNPARMKMAKAMGAEKVWDFRAAAVEGRAAEIKKWAAGFKRGDGPDVVFEASGAPSAIAEGLGLVRTLGRYIVPGQYSASGQVAINPEIITFKAITVVGSSQYSVDDVNAYLAFLKKHKDLQAVFAKSITKKYKVKDADKALRETSAGCAVKAVFVGE